MMGANTVTSPQPDRLVVVVPVHNEEALLPRCVDSMRSAIGGISAAVRAELAIDVVFVLDACDDRSATIVAGSPFEWIQIEANNVGVARASGIDLVLARHESTVDLRRVWIANTDADSAVPANWLSHQIVLAAAGVQLMIGTVRPDPRDLDAARRARWLATHRPGEANGHVHGANLGIRADAYRSAGGFDPIAEHEDVRLAERVCALGAKVAATDECWVLTSGRSTGRTPGGYARYIRDDLVPDDVA